MKYDIVEGLSKEEILNLYDNVIETPQLITNRQIYATRVDCDNGLVLQNVSFCTPNAGTDNEYGYQRSGSYVVDLSRSAGGKISVYSSYWCACFDAGCYTSCIQNQGCHIEAVYNGYCGPTNNSH